MRNYPAFLQEILRDSEWDLKEEKDQNNNINISQPSFMPSGKLSFF